MLERKSYCGMLPIDFPCTSRIQFHIDSHFAMRAYRETKIFEKKLYSWSQYRNNKPKNKQWLVLNKQTNKQTNRLEWSHGKQIGHHGAETGRQAWLCNEAKFEFADTNDIISSFPIPWGNVQKISFIMILHQLNDHSNVVRIVFDRNDSHYISCIFCIRILTIFVGQYQTSISIVHFYTIQIDRIHYWTLEKFDRSKMSFNQAFKFKIWWFSM